MTNAELDRLLAGISVYQDVVIEGRTMRRGERDCEARWSLIEPHLPESGVVLDVGSNFGWFGLRAATTRPELLVLSVEADERSARVQHLVLQSSELARVLLVTRRADAAMVERCAAGRRTFDAVLCLSVLHWMPDHRAFLQSLATRAKRIFLEFPAARECDVGVQRIRDEIGEFESYLRVTFPRHELRCLGSTRGLEASDDPRALWLVESGPGVFAGTSLPRLDAEAVLTFGPAWPNRAWWQGELACCKLPTAADSASNAVAAADSDAAIWITPHGLVLGPGGQAEAALARLERQIARVPETGLFTRRERWRRKSRRLGRALLGRVNALGQRLSFSR